MNKRIEKLNVWLEDVQMELVTLRRKYDLSEYMDEKSMLEDAIHLHERAEDDIVQLIKSLKKLTKEED